MKFILFISVILVIISIYIFPQQMPLKIGNEWHYTYGLGPVTAPFTATVVDTERIDNELYYKIERWDTVRKEVTRITYDRMVGDSLYYRIVGDSPELIFNFNRKDGEIVSTSSYYDSNCVDLKLILVDTVSFWGLETDRYLEICGLHCEGMTDTGWTLSGFTYYRNFGCGNAMDGALIGAKIDGITYGNLHTVPVELLSFSAFVELNTVHILWSTATETNNYGFEIFRNRSFAKFIQGSGTKTTKSVYEYEDKSLDAGNYRYEIIQIDLDGTRKNIAETEVNINIPKQYALFQNYPNPFNPITTIDFQIPEESRVDIKIFDYLGNEIKTLVSEIKKEGTYTIKFDASKLSAGIYFYQMSAVNFSSTKKMLLLK